MAIYARWGGEIGIVDARMIPVWIINKGHEITWKYQAPKKVSKHWKVEEQPIWHYRGYWKDSSSPVCDGKWIEANSLKADDGWDEIEKRLLELSPDAERKFNQWNKTGSPEASYFFPTAAQKDVA